MNQIQLLANQAKDRWYPLIPHPTQLAMVQDDIRFKVVCAGRRSGKSERSKRYLVKKAMTIPGSYFVAAPTYSQVKKIYWDDLQKLCFTNLLPDSTSQSELIIKLPNGSSISLIGLDKPSRFEGIIWHGGIIDEIADIKSSAWAENIAPALDTYNPMNPDYKAWCILTGVPEGRNFYYDLAQYAMNSNDPEWKYYHWTSADILPKDTIEAAKRRMSAKQFRQEYEASFETASGLIYEDYSNDNHTNESIIDTEILYWCHDFNYTPLSSCIAVNRNNNLFILDEIILNSAVVANSANEFIEKYKNHKNKSVYIYGDPAGRAGEKHGQTSSYIEMEKILRNNGWQVTRKVKNAAPAIKDRQNAVRAMIRNGQNDCRLFVNPILAPYSNKGLATTQLKQGSTFQEDQSEYQHITTAIGYCIDVEFPIKIDKSVFQMKTINSINYY